MKSITTTIIFAVILYFFVPLVEAQANDYIYTTNNGMITITKYIGSGGTVNIPSTIESLPVDSIGAKSFYSCRNLISVTISTNVTIIESDAFSDCSRLTGVMIPNSVIGIGDRTFRFCHNLTNITIGAGVTSIGGYAFWGAGLTSIAIPNNVTRLGFGAFKSCVNLTNVTIGSGVTSIGNEAFGSCSNLISIMVADDNPSYSIVNNVLTEKKPTISTRSSNEEVARKIGEASLAEYKGSITMEDLLTKRDQYFGKVVELKFYAGSVSTSLGATPRLLVFGSRLSSYDYLFLCDQNALEWAVKNEKSHDFISGMSSAVYVLVDEKSLIALGTRKKKTDNGYSYTFGGDNSLSSDISSSNSILKSNSAFDTMSLPKDELEGKISRASFAGYKGSVTTEDIILKRGQYLGKVVEVKFSSASLGKMRDTPYLYITGGGSSAGSFYLCLCDQESQEWAAEVVKKPYGSSRVVYALVEENALIALGTHKKKNADGYIYSW